MGSKKGNDCVADEIYEKLKKTIINMDIEPGHPLTENALAQSLGVSRTPVREALHMLERDQLVERSHNKGYIVRGISEQDMQEIFEVRAVLESWMTGKAAEIISEENLEVMEACLDRAESLYRQGQIEESDEKSNEIHDIIAFVVNNRWGSRTIDMLSTFTMSYKKLASKQEGQIERALEEHRNILAALRAHDSELASQRMVEHIRNSQKAIQKACQNRTYSFHKYE